MTDHEQLMAVLSDQPASEDRLNFDPYAKTLAEIIADPDTRTPLTIGVFGGWGRGKTSLMQMVRGRLNDLTSETLNIHSVWFNAWLYSRETALWRAFVARVVRSIRQFDLVEEQQAALDQLEERLYQPASASDERLLLPPGCVPGLESMGAFTPASLDLLRRQAQRAGEDAQVDKLDELLRDAKLSRAVTWREQLVALDDFRRQFEELSGNVLDHGRLVVFIDDLDRCLPDKAVEVLEAVKLFLDVPGFVFLLGVDRSVIEEGIRVRYRDYKTELDGARYLEKIIQIPFRLPPIDTKTVAGYVHEVTTGNLPDARCETVFSVGLDPNPRRIKRTLNVFLLLWRLARNREDLADVIKPVRLAKIVVIQQYYPHLFDLLVKGPHYLRDLERRLRVRVETRDAQEQTVQDEGVPSDAEEISAGPLKPFLSISLLRELLICTPEDDPDANFDGPHGLTPAGVRAYIYLTRSAVEEEATTQAPEIERLPFEPQLVTVPAGPFLMGTPESEVDELFKLMQAEYEDTKREWVEREIPQHEVTLDYDYAIARYPVTNAEFARFIEDRGLVNQILTGVWLTMSYNPSAEGAFASVEYIMRDVEYGWLIRYMHSTGATAFFVVVYLHMFRGLLYGSYKAPRELVWIFGMAIYLALMAEAFMGYLLPWGQMSYWGAQVIISLFSAIPVIGPDLTQWIRGDFLISGITLNRFFALHVVALPIVILALVVLHIIALHEVGSNNPDGIDIKKKKDESGKPLDGIPFHPYYTVKDLVGVAVFLFVFCVVIFYFPEGGGYFLEKPNFEPANPLKTPDHIAPVWYFTPFYAILRAITFSLFGLDAKFLGVICMGAAIAVLFVLPWLDRSPVRSMRYKGWMSKTMLALFAISFVVLGVLGVLPVTDGRTLLSQVCTVIYFAFFLLMPFYTRLEKTKPVPERVTG